ncbi:MAG: hypothetical protein U0736_21035 [Gemmataceae bacterium]
MGRSRSTTGRKPSRLACRRDGFRSTWPLLHRSPDLFVACCAWTCCWTPPSPKNDRAATVTAYVGDTR